MGDMRKVGALWHKTSQKGTSFYSGKIDTGAMTSALVGGETRLMLFKNKQPGGTRPDLELFAVAPSERRESHPARASRVDDADTYGDLP